MSFPMKIRFTDSLAFRLTLLYTGLSAAALIALLAVSYLILSQALWRELDEHLAIETEELSGPFARQQFDIIEEELDREVESEGANRIYYRIMRFDGSVVVETDPTAWRDLGVDSDAIARAASGESSRGFVPRGERGYRGRVLYAPGGPSHVVLLAQIGDDREQVLTLFRNTFGVVSVVCILCAFAIGAFMARRSLHGVWQVSDAARDISSGSWSRRVQLGGRKDEIFELAQAFNDMIGRVESLIRELRDVSDDIAHDLRTPITRIRAASEACFENPMSPPESHDLAGSVLEECDRLLQLINTMLEISRIGAGATTIKRVPVDLGQVVDDVVDLFKPAADDKGLHVNLDAARDLYVSGDAQKIGRAIAHIVDNAVKYTAAPGEISVTCQRRNGSAVVLVTDSGPGIETSDLDRIFDRFYRVDRSRSGTGSGLGLSVSRAICVAHGGNVVAKSDITRGSEFEVTLPLDSPRAETRKTH